MDSCLTTTSPQSASSTPVVAQELPRAERDRIYEIVVQRAEGFGEYQQRTDRIIPVFELVPKG